MMAGKVIKFKIQTHLRNTLDSNGSSPYTCKLVLSADDFNDIIDEELPISFRFVFVAVAVVGEAIVSFLLAVELFIIDELLNFFIFGLISFGSAK